MFCHVGRIHEYCMDTYILKRKTRYNSFFVEPAQMISKMCIVGLFKCLISVGHALGQVK